jgi:hypothetical protein
VSPCHRCCGCAAGRPLARAPGLTSGLRGRKPAAPSESGSPDLVMQIAMWTKPVRVRELAWTGLARPHPALELERINHLVFGVSRDGEGLSQRKQLFSY